MICVSLTMELWYRLIQFHSSNSSCSYFNIGWSSKSSKLFWCKCCYQILSTFILKNKKKLVYISRDQFTVFVRKNLTKYKNCKKPINRRSSKYSIANITKWNLLNKSSVFLHASYLTHYVSSCMLLALNSLVLLYSVVYYLPYIPWDALTLYLMLQVSCVIYL